MTRLYNGVRLLGDGPSISNIQKIDHGALPMIMAMAREGLQVDLDHFHKMEDKLTTLMEQTTEDVRSLTGYYVNLDSGEQVSELLFKKLGLKQARTKLTKSGKRESVVDEVLTAIQHDSPVVSKIQDYKEYSKLRGTYVRPIIRLAVSASAGVWKLYPNLTTTRVPSGRLACKEPNLLAMPTRTELGRDIRRGFIAPVGWKILSVDESQIEVRLAAHYSNDAGLIKVYTNEEDIYSDFAITAFSLTDDRYCNDKGKWLYPSVHKMDHRYPAKTCILASIYDVSPAGLLEQMPVICGWCGLEAARHNCGRFRSLWTEEKCGQLIAAFYQKYPGIMEDRKRHHARARKHGYAWDMWGRILHVAGVRSIHPWIVSGALREVGNFPYQCLSADALVIQHGKGLTKLGDLVGASITLWDGATWSSGHVESAGIKESICVNAHGGLSIRCSPEHPILVCSTKGRQHWVLAGNLLQQSIKNTKIVLGEGIVGGWDWTTDKPYPLMSSDPSAFGEWLGRIASDGSLLYSSRNKYTPKSVRLLIAEHEKAILPQLKESSDSFGLFVSTTVDTKAEYAPMHRLEINNQELTRQLIRWGVKSRVPDIAWQHSSILRGYLRGMFDGDGGVFCRPRGTVYLTFGPSEYKEQWARGIQLALSWFGIRSRLHVYSYYTRLCIQRRDLPLYDNLIGFINPRKSKQLRQLVRTLTTRSQPCYGRTLGIESVSKNTPIEMVDFVDSSTGRFWADGFIVHNSGAQGTIKLTMAAVHEDWIREGLTEVVKPLLQVHDELLYAVRDDVVEPWGESVKQRFETCAPLAVPIKASAARANTWGDLEK